MLKALIKSCVKTSSDSVMLSELVLYREGLTVKRAILCVTKTDRSAAAGAPVFLLVGAVVGVLPGLQVHLLQLVLGTLDLFCQVGQPVECVVVELFVRFVFHGQFLLTSILPVYPVKSRPFANII